MRNGGIASPFPVILKSSEAIDPIRLHKTAYRSIMHGNTAVSQQFRICHLNPGLSIGKQGRYRVIHYNRENLPSLKTVRHHVYFLAHLKRPALLIASPGGAGAQAIQLWLGPEFSLSLSLSLGLSRSGVGIS